MGVGGRHTPAALSPGKTCYPLYRRLGGPQGQSGQVRKISPPPKFNPRTAEPAASRYTNWAIPAPKKRLIQSEILQFTLLCTFLISCVHAMCITILICKRKILPVGEEDAKHMRRYSHIIRSPTLVGITMLKMVHGKNKFSARKIGSTD